MWQNVKYKSDFCESTVNNTEITSGFLQCLYIY